MLISIIMPAWNATAYLRRAIDSCCAQTHADWELIVIDDASTDETFSEIENLASRESRIRPGRNGRNCGPAVTRNVALSRAKGEWIAYLDADDELLPDYLASIQRHCTNSDVLFFEYDHVETARNANILTWCPAEQRDDLFLLNPAVPLGVAHRRELVQSIGGFNESLWYAEEWELWKRFARAGAGFLFTRCKSGRYHLRADSLCRNPRITDVQRIQYISNRKKGRPLYEIGVPRSRALPSRVLFGSSHCLVDPTSGAAAATLRWLKSLSSYGCDVEAMCLSKFDVDEELCVEEVICDAQVQESFGGNWRRNGIGTRWLRCVRSGVRVIVARTIQTRRDCIKNEEIVSFLEQFERQLIEKRPDVFVTFGGDEITQAMSRLVRRRDIPIVFALHNFSYANAEFFHSADYVLAPSQFSSQCYWDTIGLHTAVIPNIVDPAEVVSPELDRKYVAFVNPQMTKGVYIFARIAEQIARRRPDIPMLVVESRGRAKESLEATGLDLSFANNLFFMNSTTDPRQIYAVSKVVLMPSLWWESFGLVAAEAMTNGIPVLASDRGALPEIVGDAGLLFNIPDRYTPTSTDVPTAEEVEPWVSAIERLWDDQSWYDDFAERGRKRAERWHPKVVGPKLYDFFAEAFPQPNPPFVPEPWPIES